MNRREGMFGMLAGLLGATARANPNPVPAAPGTPATLREAIPADYLAAFSDRPHGSGPPGLYLSSYLDWHRLLLLRPDGRYHLLFWKIDRFSFERVDMRDYSGRYRVVSTRDGDERVVLDIGSKELKNGADARDELLLFMRSGNTKYLLRETDLQHMAYSIRENGRLDQSDNYLFEAALSDPFVEEPYEGRTAPPVEDLPHALRKLVTAPPLRMTITEVDDIEEEDIGEVDDYDTTVMCTLSLGEENGLYMNMPLFSPKESDRQLRGWVWRMHPTNCRAGIKCTTDADGRIIDGPVVGDVLTTAAPND
ncbi:hypothetical protein [Qipengyuania qiaonensis]|uniref:DUF4912 domain-containing protein n=1 Tax=Qipengyuania qiaonensis TaxID=2867240 RepID=A0ABS7JA46_9SPHN|nr:hypothetical protein [Qipengyuania qiaonensis]MBX7482563.1 hypothetical protein [Qipengyuania qiaonensis]